MDERVRSVYLQVPDGSEIDELLLRFMRGINSYAFHSFGNKVYLGPFAGMEVPEMNPAWFDGNAGCKMTGSYEHELHEAVEHAIWRKPGTVINVGCAEGFYAIGFARRLPGTKVIGIDLESKSLDLCEDYAKRNGVKVETICGFETAEELREVPVGPGHALYVFDCEGAEKVLVDPMVVTALQRADLIVECHDFMDDGLSGRIADRLEGTHRVEVVRPRLPDFSRFEFLRNFPTMSAALIVLEKRPPNSCWLVAWAHRKGR